MSQKIITTPSTPRTIHYRGDKIVLAEQDQNGFGPGSMVHIDADGDGVFEHRVTTDDTDYFTITFAAPQDDGAFVMYSSSADGSRLSDRITVFTVKDSEDNPAQALPEKFDPAEPGICTCISCSNDAVMMGDSTNGYSRSNTPNEHGVDLATGKLRQSFPITGFETRVLGFDLQLHHSSLISYDGPWGSGFSHSFNMIIVQTSELNGLIITADLRCYEIFSEDGVSWKLPCGFYSRLCLDNERQRWTLTHFSGLAIDFYQGTQGCPGYPLSICDPNGNTMRLDYDASGLLQSITTDSDQVQTLSYNADGLLDSFTDHIDRQWLFVYDAQHRLIQIKTPETEYANIAAGQEVGEDDLEEVMVSQSRIWQMAYTNEGYPSHITSLTDPRGAVPNEYRYNASGQVAITRINDNAVNYDYSPESSQQLPLPLALLDRGNRITRVIDRVGNISDYEIHGDAGSPVNGFGRYGLRRMLTWTERAKGNEPLRDDEPLYWEQRWLHDCECLAPAVAVQAFSSDDSETLDFDGNGIPKNWPRELFSYNDNRQVVRSEYTDGIDSIVTQSTYQDGSFGDQDQFSRLLSQTDPRSFDDNPIYAGLNFEHRYQYDQFGNRIRHDEPTVTRGVSTPQIISEFWSYNSAGQVLNYTDANANISLNSYYDGPSSGGDINTQGEFGGYLKSVTRGADGSSDAVTNLMTTYKVNALGMTTRAIDPKGFVYDTEYNDMQETTRKIEPLVTLHTGSQVRYGTLHIYDGAGNEVLHRRSNIDYDGTVPANAFVDRSMSFDSVNNLLSDRVEVDDNAANDLITRYAYDANDDLIVTEKPERNREFQVYDERRLLFKTFYGVAPGLRLLPVDINFPRFDKRRLLLTAFNVGGFATLNAANSSAYPSDKRAETLNRTAFVGFTVDSYDARRNPIRRRDGRGNFEDSFFDFYNREIAYSDQNGNGWVREFDDASNVLTESRGPVDKTTGQISQLLERSYARFDEIGRKCQQVRDIDLNSDQSQAINPGDDNNSSYFTVFDPGSRVLMQFDANGNPTSMEYDAANRMLSKTDALNNVERNDYDENSNVVRVREIERPDPGGSGRVENYVTTFRYDELNRRIEQHILGRVDDSIDHAWFFAYDSRNNRRLVRDAESNYLLTSFDDVNREISLQRFDGDPASATTTELLHYEWAYDRNSNKIEERALSDIDDPASVQITRYAYDDLDRLIRSVLPDSDDPINGRGNGADSVFDRIEVTYDENSNMSQIVDQRDVVFKNSFDAGNRLVDQVITLPSDVPGTTQQNYTYDALNRLTSACNDYAKIDQDYDGFSRVVAETQSIRLDGSGFSRGWQGPVKLAYDYDKQSNRLRCQVSDNDNADLDVATRFDALNRVAGISAAYFNIPTHAIANYAYVGPWRVQKKILGNGATLNCSYDSKRRLKIHQWNSSKRLLAGFEYDYDRMDNALFERFTHDLGLYDHFRYNDRYEIIGVSYRVPGGIPPATLSNTFVYNDVFNRRQASFGGPFEESASTVDSYAINEVNEYTRLTRNGNASAPRYDRAGNATGFLIRPVISDPNQSDAAASARWDAFNCLFDIDPGGVNPQQHYRYDPFRRRIAAMELNNAEIGQGSRRYIYDGWSVIEERLFDENATLDSASSALERIYINGKELDEPLLTAIDRDRDGLINSNNNVADLAVDKEYYFLNNRLGSVMALLDAGNADRILEYYRYTVYGEASVLPVVDVNSDGFEDTPLNLADNFASGAKRVSDFGNVYLFTARRFDDKTGLYYYRNRYYETQSGRFISRDLIGYRDQINLYSYVADRPNNFVDPLGLKAGKISDESEVSTLLTGSHYVSRDYSWHTRDENGLEENVYEAVVDNCQASGSVKSTTTTVNISYKSGVTRTVTVESGTTKTVGVGLDMKGFSVSASNAASKKSGFSLSATKETTVSTTHQVTVLCPGCAKIQVWQKYDMTIFKGRGFAVYSWAGVWVSYFGKGKTSGVKSVSWTDIGTEKRWFNKYRIKTLSGKCTSTGCKF